MTTDRGRPVLTKSMLVVQTKSALLASGLLITGNFASILDDGESTWRCRDHTDSDELPCFETIL